MSFFFSGLSAIRFFLFSLSVSQEGVGGGPSVDADFKGSSGEREDRQVSQGESASCLRHSSAARVASA